MYYKRPENLEITGVTVETFMNLVYTFVNEALHNILLSHR